jgi:hypothetical protein
VTVATTPTSIALHDRHESAGFGATLPIGLEIDGTWTREVELVGITGRILDAMREDSLRTPAERFTGVLHLTVARLGALERPGRDVVRLLCAGDRDALALHLHRLVAGPVIDAVLACPLCGELMDVELSVERLLLAPADRPAEETVRIGERDLVVRSPNGAELEAAGRIAVDPDAAVASLLAACVRTLDGEPVALAPEDHDAVSAALARLDPQSDLEIEVICPSCARDVSALLDPPGFLLRELDRRARSLEREIHVLALHYHWSEGDILDMPEVKRGRYLTLIEESLEAGGSR